MSAIIGNRIAVLGAVLATAGCGTASTSQNASSSPLETDLRPLVEQALPEEPLDSDEPILSDPLRRLLSVGKERTRLIELRVRNNGGGSASATGTASRTVEVTGDARGVGRLLASGQTVSVSSTVPISATFTKAARSWRLKRIEGTGVPAVTPLSEVDRAAAKRHAKGTIRGLLTWTRADEDAYIADKEKWYATGRDSARLDEAESDRDQTALPPPRLGGDASFTSLGLLGDPSDPSGETLDSLLPASDGTVPGPQLGSDCVLDLKRLSAGGIELDGPGADPNGEKPDGLTERLRFRGTVDVTASEYRCGGAAPEAVNTLAFIVEVARVRAATAPWKTSLVVLGAEGADPESLVYQPTDDPETQLELGEG